MSELPPKKLYVKWCNRKNIDGTISTVPVAQLRTSGKQYKFYRDDITEDLLEAAKKAQMALEKDMITAPKTEAVRALDRAIAKAEEIND